SFDRPINVTANTKYWIVIEGVCVLSNFGSSCSSPAYSFATIYRSDGRSGDYGGTVLHYETSSDGMSWSSPTLEGDLSFILVASTSTIKTYNTTTLYNEIVSENDQSTANIPAQGWNAFLGAEQSTLMSKLTMMMTGLMGQQSYWFTGLPANVADSSPFFKAADTIYGDSGAGGVIGCPPSTPSCGGVANFWANDAKDHETDILSAPDQANWLPWSSFGSTLDNRGELTPVNIQTEYLYGLPLTARNILSFNDFSSTVTDKGIYNMTQTKYADAFGALLNRMEYSGTYFGGEKDAVNILWIGSSDDGIFPQFLTPAVNLTFIASDYPDQNLTAFGNLKQFNVIVGDLSAPTSSFQARLASFVSTGGGYVDTSFGSGAG
ncbi:MAG: hypothetical protein ACRD6W_03975, partial [Nitrososphaerales archaeon]